MTKGLSENEYICLSPYSFQRIKCTKGFLLGAKFTPTHFSVTLDLRISKDMYGNEKFTKEFIVDEMMKGNVVISVTKDNRKLNFLEWLSNNHQIMAQIYEFRIKKYKGV